MSSPRNLDFLGQVDLHLYETFGITYTHLVGMAESIEEEFFPRNMSPTDFASAFAKVHGLRTVDSMAGNTEEARRSAALQTNERIAAIAEFCNDSRWKPDGLGGASLEVNGERLVISVCERDGKQGFGVERPDREEKPYVRLDIKEAVRGKMMEIRMEKDGNLIVPEREPVASSIGMR